MQTASFTSANALSHAAATQPQLVEGQTANRLPAAQYSRTKLSAENQFAFDCLQCDMSPLPQAILRPRLFLDCSVAVLLPAAGWLRPPPNAACAKALPIACSGSEDPPVADAAPAVLWLAPYAEGVPVPWVAP